ncbi:MAG: SRPBCC family protein [Gammaproteobacteria bacterium]|nr:SRPBCC family protein [Gammaproteobacteria bacterium]
MKRLILTLLALPSLMATMAIAQEYVAIEMEIDVDKPAAEVWSKVGGYCDISEWLGLDCEITAGNGALGTVRSLLNGRILEILVAETELSYGYTQPAPEDGFYDHYHGFLEARPVSANSSKLLYTLMLDVSNLEDQAAKDADVARRRGMFEGALAAMKKMAEQ